MGSYDKELEAAREIARQAGDAALVYRENGIGYDSKSDESPVTIADRECEKLIVAAIEKAFPEDGLLGEEGAMKNSTNRRKWIIDPIDGTRDFIRGTRAWSVLIGLEEEDEVVAGVAYFPSYGEMFSASKGGGAWWSSAPGAAPTQMQISAIARFSDAMVCVNGLNYMQRYPFKSSLLEWMSDAWAVRSMGGCLDAMLVASGRADIWIEAQAKPWDLAPLQIIAEEAGAVTFDFQGDRTIYGGNFIISAPSMADGLKRYFGRTEPE